MSIRTHAPAVSPTPATIDLAQKALVDFDRPGSHFALVDSATGVKLPLSDQMVDLLRQMFNDFARNKAIAVLPVDDELTPNQAADLLNVSRGFVLRRIEDGTLLARMVGTHHRIRLADLMTYKQRADAESDKAMDEVIAIGQELGLD